jgi:release factor glutamine methyltransferase
MPARPETAQTAQTALRAATQALAAAGNASPRVDAELLLAYAADVDRGKLVLLDALGADVSRRFQQLVAERAAGAPLQHLTGSAPFRHIELAVGPGVFIPRPETELMLELAADELAEARVVLDLCAGSGAIALAVAQEHPQARVIAVERSPDALPWLRSNAASRLGAGDRAIEIEAADVLELAREAEPLGLAELTGRVDVVLTNPPYVPAGTRGSLPREVAHDPDDAVFAGPDGLALMPALARLSARLLRGGGRLVIEHDESQCASLPAMLAATGDWTDVQDRADLGGRSRFVLATRAR